jgi:hypothetical protein
MAVCAQSADFIAATVTREAPRPLSRLSPPRTPLFPGSIPSPVAGIEVCNSLLRLLLMTAVCLLGGSSAFAAQVEGVNLPERVQLAGGPELVLNGAGVRTKAIFNLYVAALYLPSRSSDSTKILGDNRASRISLHILRNLTANEIVSSMDAAIRESLTPEQRPPLESRLRQFGSYFESLSEVPKGTQILIDYLPKTGTVIKVGDEELGRIPGIDFHRALLRVWIGDRPRDARLKDAMLGVAME